MPGFVEGAGAVANLLGSASGLFGGASPAGPSISDTGPVTVSVGGLNVPPRSRRNTPGDSLLSVDVGTGSDVSSKVILGVVVALVVSVVLRAIK